MTAPAGFFIVGIGGLELTPAERRILSADPPAGVLLFARNITGERQVLSLVASLRETVPGVSIFVDQEGGSVDRFRALLQRTPSLAAAAASESARSAGALAGEICAFAGVDVDLAPVVDRAVPRAGARVLTGRCASDDPLQVARMAGEFIDGLAQFGVAACLKHFPGLGRAVVDSHLELPAVEADEIEDALDLQPFRLLREKTPAMMISHAAMRGSTVPATLDPAISSVLLRDEVGFTGIAISDDLEMGALARFGDLASRSLAAFSAGCDLLCVSSRLSEFPRCAEAIAPAALGPRGEDAGRKLARFRVACAAISSGATRRPGSLREVAAEAAAQTGRSNPRPSD